MGRRFAVFTGATIMVVGAILQACSQNVGMFIGARCDYTFSSTVFSFIPYTRFLSECLQCLCALIYLPTAKLVAVLLLPPIQLQYGPIQHLRKTLKHIITIYLDADNGDCVPNPTCSADVQFQRPMVCIMEWSIVCSIDSFFSQGKGELYCKSIISALAIYTRS